jgi:hypothetical protein
MKPRHAAHRAWSDLRYARPWVHRVYKARPTAAWTRAGAVLLHGSQAGSVGHICIVCCTLIARAAIVIMGAGGGGVGRFWMQLTTWALPGCWPHLVA